MINFNEVNETIQMLDNQHLDVRTVTMGISLYDCADSDASKACARIYDKICTRAEKLVSECEKIESTLGIPIVNKRISVTPISHIASAARVNDAVCFAKALEKAAQNVGVNFLGGFSALVHKGITPGDQALINSIPEAMAVTEHICSSVNIGSTRAGINMDAVQQMGNMILSAANLTKERDSIGCAKIVVFCNAVEDNPFMAGAFLGCGEGDCVINVGVSGPGVVKCALEKMPNASLGELAEEIKKTAFKITRMGQLVASRAAKQLNAQFGIVDLSLAPTPTMGDSVAHILEEMGLASTGGPGTTAALAMLNDAVKKGGVMASSYVGGLSGAFIPVSEDIGMINAAKSGNLTLEKLEAMTCVCSVGLDMIAIPGNTSASTISGIIADEAAIGMVNSNTTAVRVIPVMGKGVGEMVSFGGLLGEAPIMPVNTTSCEKFISRAGRIPAPLQSLKN